MERKKKKKKTKKTKKEGAVVVMCGSTTHTLGRSVCVPPHLFDPLKKGTEIGTALSKIREETTSVCVWLISRVNDRLNTTRRT